MNPFISSVRCSYCNYRKPEPYIHINNLIRRIIQSDNPYDILKLNRAELQRLNRYYKFGFTNRMDTLICNIFSIWKLKNARAAIISNLDTYECPICMGSIDISNLIITDCLHAFCSHCIMKHVTRNQTCPLCRRAYCLQDAIQYLHSYHLELDKTIPVIQEERPPTLNQPNCIHVGQINLLLHRCTFKTLPLGEQGDADCALKMRNGVKIIIIIALQLWIYCIIQITYNDNSTHTAK